MILQYPVCNQTASPFPAWPTHLTSSNSTKAFLRVFATYAAFMAEEQAGCGRVSYTSSTEDMQEPCSSSLPPHFLHPQQNNKKASVGGGPSLLLSSKVSRGAQFGRI